MDVKDEQSIVGYKLFRLRKDGTLGPLFINRKQVIQAGEWLEAQLFPTPGFAVRFGWHACAQMSAPHLSKKGRVWCRVRLYDITANHRTGSQGGLLYTARYLKVTDIYF